jgi:LPS-assembly protein
MMTVSVPRKRRGTAMHTSFRMSLLALAGAVGFGVAMPSEAFAQAKPGTLGFGVDSMPRPAANAQMVLESDQLVYDYDKAAVSAVGAVKIYYDGYTLEADRVTYDQKNKKMRAEGRVKIVDRTGATVTADTIDITDDFATGFVEALRLDTPTQTHFAAEKALRDQGKTTTFYRGVYTACEPCRERPEKAPIWQVKAARIIVDHNEHMVYFKRAQLEFLGMPVAYFPAFSAPDPTIKRKSGFLFPSAGYKKTLGAFLQTPYFWALAPNYDITLAPAVYTNQGFLMDVEWRHRLEHGQYSLRMAGINQLNPEDFYDDDGDSRNSGVKDWRGGIQTQGEFYLNRYWTFGWDATLLSDRTFSRDYSLLSDSTDINVSTVYLTGISERNYFNASALYFQVLTNDNDLKYDQGRQAIVHPVIDHSYIFDDSILGGQLSIKSNLTSLSRDETDIVNNQGDGIEVSQGVTNGQLDDDAHILGLAGNYNRLSTQVTWQRSMVGPVGMVFKPFGYLRGDAIYANQDEIVSGLDVDGSFYRGMPAVGLEWRWPIMAAGLSSSFLFEPIAQMIVRPDEPDAGRLPNEDAQSLVFDDSSLFDWDKFSGYDRIEGGTRVNLGFRYLASIGSVATIQGVVGQSYQVAGENSFAVANITDTGAVSGLETDVSDVVAGVTLDTGYGYFLSARGRFDEANLDVNRAEVTATGKFGTVTASASYLFMREQPAIGNDERTDTISARASWQMTDTWRVFGSVAWDIEGDQMASSGLGIAYDDECTTFSIAYSEIRDDYTDLETSKQLMVRLELRTLGGTKLRSDVGELSSSN